MQTNSNDLLVFISVLVIMSRDAIRMQSLSDRVGAKEEQNLRYLDITTVFDGTWSCVRG